MRIRPHPPTTLALQVEMHGGGTVPPGGQWKTKTRPAAHTPEKDHRSDHLNPRPLGEFTPRM